MLKTLLVAILIGAFAQSADAAILYLKDGGTLEGTLLNSTTSQIQLQTKDGQTVTIGADQVVRIDYQPEKPTPAQTRPTRAEIFEQERPYLRRQAMEFDRSQELSFGLGLGIPLSRVSFKAAGGGSASNGSLGFLGGVQYLGFPSSRWGLGASFDFFGRSSARSSSLLPYADTAVYGRSIVMMAMARYTITDKGNTRPYFLFGAGAHHTSTIIDAAPKFGFTWSDTSTAETRSLVDDEHWGPAATARFGVDFHYLEQYLVAFELGWIGFDSPRYEATSQGQDLGVVRVSGLKSALTIGGRWGWRF